MPEQSPAGPPNKVSPLLCFLLEIAGTLAVPILVNNIDSFFRKPSNAVQSAMVPPSKININGQAFRIRTAVKDEQKWMEEDNDVAITDCKTQQIVYISEKIPNLQETMWHEVFHAGECLHDPEYWNSKNVRNFHDVHPGIYHLGEFMDDFSKTNPEFLYWASHQ